MEAVRAIYAHYVLTSVATFEETPPPLDEMLARRRASIDNGLPYLVAEVAGAVVGFAYAGVYRARPAYRFTVEIRSMSRPSGAPSAPAGPCSAR